MIDRAHIETRLATLREQREVQGRQLLDLQQAARASERACAQLDGALLVLQELLADGTPEEERNHVHGT